MVGLNNVYARLSQGRGRDTYLPLIVLSLHSLPPLLLCLPPLFLLRSGAVISCPLLSLTARCCH